MISFLQSDSFPEKTFFLLSYLNEDCIKPFYFSEAGARILKVPTDTSTEENISSTMNQVLKKYIKDATLSNDFICCTVSVPAYADTNTQVWLLSLYAFKQNGSYFIFGDGIASQCKYGQMTGDIPKEIFEDLFVSNPNHILFGIELDSLLELILTCYGPSIPYLLDYPIPPNHGENLRLDSLLTASNYCIIRSHVLQCFNNRGNHSYVYCKESSTAKKYYSIRMIGYIHGTKKSVYGTAIDITDYMNAQQSVLFLHQNIISLFDNFDEAACMIYINADRPPETGTQSVRFVELATLNPRFLSDLLTQKVCNHLLINKSPLSFKKVLRNKMNEDKNYDISITPLYQESQGTLLIVSALPSFHLPTFRQQITDSLTPREQQVIGFVLSGEKNIVIACHLNITEGTVKKIISNAYKKLHVTSRTELIKQYLVAM